MSTKLQDPVDQAPPPIVVDSDPGFYTITSPLFSGDEDFYECSKRALCDRQSRGGQHTKHNKTQFFPDNKCRVLRKTVFFREKKTVCKKLFGENDTPRIKNWRCFWGGCELYKNYPESFLSSYSTLIFLYTYLHRKKTSDKNFLFYTFLFFITWQYYKDNTTNNHKNWREKKSLQKTDQVRTIFSNYTFFQEENYARFFKKCFLVPRKMREMKEKDLSSLSSLRPFFASAPQK